ncbi:lysozyme inhibitor LprI family protein [Dyella sp.]|uniref:lysozyme inhibitor LprI family protein n=1 Tax=Dyella sp. TaxID=1869338 RepID=UPI003F7FFBAC
MSAGTWPKPYPNQRDAKIDMVFRKSFRVFGAALCIAAFHASAQESAEFSTCLDQAAGASEKMLECHKAEVGRWDLRLNAAYQMLLHRYKDKQRAQLQQEQRAWLKHHLSEAHRLAAQPEDIGDAAFLESESFELDDLIKRTLALEKLVNQK